MTQNPAWRPVLHIIAVIAVCVLHHARTMVKGEIDV